MPETTIEIRGKIIAMYESGMLKSTIAEKLQINPRTVSRWIKRNKNEGNLKSKGKAYRSKCTTSCVDQQIVEYVKHNPQTTINDIKKDLQLNCSAATITRRLKSNNIKHVTDIKPALSNSQKEQKLGFALQYVAYDNEFQRKDLISDGKIFSIKKKHVDRLQIQNFQKIIYL